jgi:hypothetical protein
MVVMEVDDDDSTVTTVERETVCAFLPLSERLDGFSIDCCICNKQD